MEIERTEKIQVKESPIHGLGVFATDDIEVGELIEECPILFLPNKRGEVNIVLTDYTYQWPKVLDWENFVVALGYGSLYNHSDIPNADWDSDVEKQTFKFTATKKIKKGDEITIFYGGQSYWDERKHIKVK